jgi:UDP-N-acetylmuramoyl-L-alanyl-D-glutamate--2,6-diaminopimelate ligase
MSLDNLLKTLGKYKGVTDDSRQVKKGFVYVAVKGLVHDGHDFIPEALKNGAAVVVGEKDLNLKGSPYLKVQDSRAALGELAAALNLNPSQKLTVIGVTGTDGKTTTANLIYAILTKAGIKCGLVSTINARVGDEEIDTGFHVTNPEPLLLQELLAKMVEKDCKFAVLEVTSHGLDQQRVTGVKFDTGVLTNVTHEHLDYHKTYNNYLEAKAKLFREVKTAILNTSDSSYELIKPLVNPQAKILTYPEASLSPEIIKSIAQRFPESYNRLNAQAAVLVAKNYGVGEEIIAEAIASFENLTGRMEEMPSSKPFKVIVDFAHTPNALASALKAARVKTEKSGKLIAVFGSAGERDVAKRKKMGEAAASLADISVITAEDPRSENPQTIIDEIAQGFENKNENSDFYKIPERGEAIAFAVDSLAGKGDVVVICGKGHEKSMAYSGVEYPWSDQEAVSAALKGETKKIERWSFKTSKRVHLTGIKGVGMTSLALCLNDMGISVTGSDTGELFVTDEILKRRGIAWREGFSQENLTPLPDLLITTGAHGGLANPEAVFARSQGIPTVSHAEALANLGVGKDTITVCGVGGKTTTSSILAVLLDAAGLKPSFAVGVGNIFPINTPGRYVKEGKHFICEGDEFAVSPGINNAPRFSFLNPKIIVVTNIEHDHPDIYPDIKSTKATFRNFFSRVPADGVLIACSDNANVVETIKDINVPVTTYGFSPQADWRIEDIKKEAGKISFSLTHKDQSVKEITIRVPGDYNVLNAAAAFVVGKFLGIGDGELTKGMWAYAGCQRRFEIAGEGRGVTIIDDYAHHPKEIKAVIKAAKEWYPGRRIVAVFQPHTYSRTKALFTDFASSFGDADVAAFMDIYSSAREKKDESVSSERLAEETKKLKKESYYIGGHQEAATWLKKNLKKGDVALTLGAGDIFYLHSGILK